MQRLCQVPIAFNLCSNPKLLVRHLFPPPPSVWLYIRNTIRFFVYSLHSILRDSDFPDFLSLYALNFSVWAVNLCGFWQMHSVKHPPLKYHTEYFRTPKKITCVCFKLISVPPKLRTPRLFLSRSGSGVSKVLVSVLLHLESRRLVCFLLSALAKLISLFKQWIPRWAF